MGRSIIQPVLGDNVKIYGLIFYFRIGSESE
jgi:hypothetical protein